MAAETNNFTESDVMNTPNTVSITDPASGASARILVSLGFNCFSWRPMLPDGLREMLWAHQDFAAGNEGPSGSGIPLLFPFPGRLAMRGSRSAAASTSSNPATALAMQFMALCTTGRGGLLSVAKTASAVSVICLEPYTCVPDPFRLA